MNIPCLLPSEPRAHDDYCHTWCVQVDAFRTSKELLSLQQSLRDQLVLLLAAMRDQTRALVEFAQALRGIPTA